MGVEQGPRLPELIRRERKIRSARDRVSQMIETPGGALWPDRLNLYKTQDNEFSTLTIEVGEITIALKDKTVPALERKREEINRELEIRIPEAREVRRIAELVEQGAYGDQGPAILARAQGILERLKDGILGSNLAVETHEESRGAPETLLTPLSTDGSQPEVDREENVIEVGTQATEPQRFNIEDIATALGLVITKNNLALVRTRFYRAVKKDPTIQFDYVAEKGRRGKPRISLTKENFEKAIEAIREQKRRGRKSRPLKGTIRESSRGGEVQLPDPRGILPEAFTPQGGRNGEEVHPVVPSSNEFGPQGPRIAWGSLPQATERTKEEERRRVEEATRRAKRQVGLNLTRTILSHLAAGEFGSLSKNIYRLLDSCLPSGASLESVMRDNPTNKNSEDFLIALFSEIVEEFWGVQKANKFTAVERKIAESCIQLRWGEQDVKSIVNTVCKFFSVQVPDGYRDVGLTIALNPSATDGSREGNRAQRRGKNRGTNWDRLGHQGPKPQPYVPRQEGILGGWHPPRGNRRR